MHIDKKNRDDDDEDDDDDDDDDEDNPKAPLWCFTCLLILQ